MPTHACNDQGTGALDPKLPDATGRFEELELTQRAVPAIVRTDGDRQETSDSPNAIHARDCVEYSAR
jgi:hypothetical protein